jgi:hypothetical protein
MNASMSAPVTPPSSSKSAPSRIAFVSHYLHLAKNIGRANDPPLQHIAVRATASGRTPPRVAQSDMTAQSPQAAPVFAAATIAQIVQSSGFPARHAHA